MIPFLRILQVFISFRYLNIKKVFPNFNFKNKQGFLKDHYLIIASKESKKELEINISQRNAQNLIILFSNKKKMKNLIKHILNFLISTIRNIWYFQTSSHSLDSC